MLIAAPPCFTHDTAEYVTAALQAGFELVAMREDRDEQPDPDLNPLNVPRLISFMFKKKP